MCGWRSDGWAGGGLVGGPSVGGAYGSRCPDAVWVSVEQPPHDLWSLVVGDGCVQRQAIFLRGAARHSRVVGLRWAEPSPLPLLRLQLRPTCTPAALPDAHTLPPPFQRRLNPRKRPATPSTRKGPLPLLAYSYHSSCRPVASVGRSCGRSCGTGALTRCWARDP